MQTNNKFIKNISTLVLSIFIAAVFTSCYADDKTKTSVTGQQLIWYPGLILDKMLDKTLLSVTKQDMGELLKADWYDSFDLVNPMKATDTITIKTCLEFFLAAQRKMQPVNTNDAIPYMELGMMCHAANVVYNGKDAENSYYGDFKFDKKILNTFPPNLANIISVEERKRLLANSKITSWAQAGNIKSIDIVNDEKAIVKAERENQEIELLSKGDFNDDSIADIIVLVRNTVDEGTSGSVELFMLTKKKNTENYELIKEFKVF